MEHIGNKKQEYGNNREKSRGNTRRKGLRHQQGTDRDEATRKTEGDTDDPGLKSFSVEFVEFPVCDKVSELRCSGLGPGGKRGNSGQDGQEPFDRPTRALEKYDREQIERKESAHPATAILH
jgi:hypothetical protein